MVVPDQARHLGGAFACPSCRGVNTLAVAAQLASPMPGQRPRMPVPASMVSVSPQHVSMDSPQRAAPQRVAPTRFERFLRRASIFVFSSVLAMLACLVLAFTVPVAAITLGMAITGLTVFYLANESMRTRVDRAFKRREPRRWVGTTMAILVGSWAFTSLFVFGSFVASGGIERAKAERHARELAAQDAAEKQRAADEATHRAQADAMVDDAKSAAAKGEFGHARDLAEKIRDDMPGHAGAEGVLQQVSDGLRQQLVAALPAKLAEIKTNMAGGRWREAGVICDEIKEVLAEDGDAQVECQRVSAQMRKGEVEGWIQEARRVAADECDTPKSIAEAWGDLRKVVPGDGGFSAAKRAAAALEKCRKRTERELEEGVRQVMMSQRERRASEIENVMLEEGFDVSVTLKGKYKDQLRIRWVLIGRALVHQFTKDGELLAGLQKIGFQRVVFSDGYYESYTYELEPDSEAGGGKIALAGLGLDEPIKM